jgi:hypothetical protein
MRGLLAVEPGVLHRPAQSLTQLPAVYRRLTISHGDLPARRTIDPYAVRGHPEPAHRVFGRGYCVSWGQSGHLCLRRVHSPCSAEHRRDCARRAPQDGVTGRDTPHDGGRPGRR